MPPINRIFDLLELYRTEFRNKQQLFCCKEGKAWRAYSAADYLRISRLIGQGLMGMGAGKGSRIGTVMINSPHWNFFDMGIMQAGAIQVPIYPNIGMESFRYILNDSEIEYLIIFNNEIYQRIKDLLPEIKSLREVFSIRKIKGVRHWTEILERGKDPSLKQEFEKVRESILPDDLATVIYTSGTTGRPKGVMLSHRNFTSNFMECAQVYRFSNTDRALSFLPLCHVYERMLNYLYQSYGMTVYYVESLDKVAGVIREVRPTTFAAVPRVLEKIYDRMVARGRTFHGIKKIVFFWALRQGHEFEMDPARDLWFEFKLFFARKLVLERWRQSLGGRIELIISGSACLHPRLARVFWAAGIPVIEGYGLTETSPVIAVTRFGPGGMKFGTVGPILPGVEVKFAEDGEILCRGPNVMMGYHNRPEKTAEVIDADGWFHTGDIGLLEDGKYLRITDRKKEMFKTSTGKYIAPQVIEQRLKESPFIENVMVIGENRKYTAALIVPNFDYLLSWCQAKNINVVSFERMLKNPRVIHRIREEVQKYNQSLGQTEKIKKFRLIHEEWSVQTGELSPTLKLRRKVIQEKYFKLIEETYHSQEFNYRVEGR
ncbi:MAG TPA: AMP-dependent synthetase/ligase [Bacteroidales bacterium]|nr:AMP-dependent synthetase/ligase [Bacteroidales bacterium]HPS74364.1 AMP-dependent synthetase/ligase [Bacteroidales bacterium]